MEQSKYWFASYFSSAYNNSFKPFSIVTDVHPFEKLRVYNEMDGYETYLISFQEISEDDYSFFKHEIDKD